MLVDDVILVVLLAWVVPLAAFIFYTLTEPVPGSRFWRRWGGVRHLRPVMRIILAQKVSLILVVSFIFTVRLVGNFPGREWVAFGLYSLLVVLACVITAYLRVLQRPDEQRIRNQPRR